VKTPTSADENPQPFELIERIEPFEHVIPPKHEGFFTQTNSQSVCFRSKLAKEQGRKKQSTNFRTSHSNYLCCICS
jgi:hypothetical protein